MWDGVQVQALQTLYAKPRGSYKTKAVWRKVRVRRTLHLGFELLEENNQIKPLWQ